MKIGIIITNRNQFLVLERNPSRYTGWGLITGKIDLGERAEAALTRELYEETGIRITKDDILKKLNLVSTYFSPRQNKEFKIQWFHLELHEKPILKLESAEWTNYEWLDFNGALERLTWDSEKDVLVNFFSIPTSREFKTRQ